MNQYEMTNTRRLKEQDNHDWEPVRIMENGRSWPHPTWKRCVDCGAEQGKPEGIGEGSA